MTIVIIPKVEPLPCTSQLDVLELGTVKHCVEQGVLLLDVTYQVAAFKNCNRSDCLI